MKSYIEKLEESCLRLEEQQINLAKHAQRVRYARMRALALFCKSHDILKPKGRALAALVAARLEEEAADIDRKIVAIASSRGIQIPRWLMPTPWEEAADRVTFLAKPVDDDSEPEG